MSRENCRENSGSRRRPRLQLVKTPAGSSDVTMRDALAAFQAATGRDFATDTEVCALLHWLKLGLDEADQPGRQRLEARAGEGIATVHVRPPVRRGAPTAPLNVTAPIVTLVALLGPSDAALAVMLGKLHHHPGFVCVAKRKPGLRFDVIELRRTIAQRLSAIAKDAERRQSAAAEQV